MKLRATELTLFFEFFPANMQHATATMIKHAPTKLVVVQDSLC